MTRDVLIQLGLKITPQRIAVLEAMNSLTDHPTAECIIDYIRRNHPNIAVGTVYKTLETFVDKGIIKKVKTERDVMRYDSILEKHHHLYCIESDRIDDYYDPDLTLLIENYFSKKEIPNFNIDDIKLQITGRFTKEVKK